MAARRRTVAASGPIERTILMIAIVGFMYFTGEVLKPLALSVLLSFALAPVSRLLERIGLPRPFAVASTVVVALGLLGVVGFVVGEQLTSLAKELPKYQQNIETKLKSVFRPDQQSTQDRLEMMVDEVTARVVRKTRQKDEKEAATIQKVAVVQEPSFQERLRGSSGPYLEFLGVGGFVLVLVLFMLIGREDLRDRIVELFGHRQISVTTRTMEEIGQRISRYLVTFALVNSSFGLVIGGGLALIGVPYAVLWGCLAAMLRFIPYVGTAVAATLPLVFSFAHFPGWLQPLEVAALFGLVEVALNSVLEPVIYGKTTGVSALGLLVAAMFWTWLWGTLGLLLSTPLTVCLAVLGKYVPSLRFFAILLGEEAEMKAEVRLYQRLVGLDRDGAVEVVETALRKQPRAEVFDQVLIPMLSRAEGDAARGELDEAELAFVWQVVGEVLDDLEGVEEFDLATASLGAPGSTEGSRELVVGLAVHGRSDALVLRMLGLLMGKSGVTFEVLAEGESPLHTAERVAEMAPRLVVVSHLPPEGLTLARYLVRRLRARVNEMPIVVGRWGAAGDTASTAERLVEIGASQVLFTLAEARERIMKVVVPSSNPSEVHSGAPLPA